MVRALLIVLLLVSVLGGAYVVLQQHPVRAQQHVTRSAAARRAFRKMHPCPATGRVKGPCPGFVIDHVKPLACGGADAPANMQWQTTAEGKAKDAVERRNCASGI